MHRQEEVCKCTCPVYPGSFWDFLCKLGSRTGWKHNSNVCMYVAQVSHREFRKAPGRHMDSQGDSQAVSPGIPKLSPQGDYQAVPPGGFPGGFPHRGFPMGDSP